MNQDRDIFLVANLGSEVTRLLLAKRGGSSERMRAAYARACDIVEELSVNTDAGGKSESAILRTVLDDLIRPQPLLSINPEALKNYFMPFANAVLRTHQ